MNNDKKNKNNNIDDNTMMDVANDNNNEKKIIQFRNYQPLNRSNDLNYEQVPPSSYHSHLNWLNSQIRQTIETALKEDNQDDDDDDVFVKISAKSSNSDLKRDFQSKQDKIDHETELAIRSILSQKLKQEDYQQLIQQHDQTDLQNNETSDSDNDDDV